MCILRGMYPKPPIMLGKSNYINRDTLLRGKLIVVEVSFRLAHPVKACDPFSNCRVSQFAHQSDDFSSTKRAMKLALSVTSSCNQSHSMGRWVNIDISDGFVTPTLIVSNRQSLCRVVHVEGVGPPTLADMWLLP